MDVILKIALVASGIIIAILFVGFYNISIDNSVECAKLNNDLYQHVLAYNESADHYRYRANDLEGQYDLPGDILAWRNHLLNEYAQIQHEISTLENKCES
jgi:hypothetical protein